MLALLASGPNVILCHVSPSFAKSRALNSYPRIRVMPQSPLTAMSLHLTATSSFLLTYFVFCETTAASLVIQINAKSSQANEEVHLVRAKWFNYNHKLEVAAVFCQTKQFSHFAVCCGPELHIPWLLTPKWDKNTWVLALSRSRAPAFATVKRI